RDHPSQARIGAAPVPWRSSPSSCSRCVSGVEDALRNRKVVEGGLTHLTAERELLVPDEVSAADGSVLHREPALPRKGRILAVMELPKIVGKLVLAPATLNDS